MSLDVRARSARNGLSKVERDDDAAVVQHLHDEMCFPEGRAAWNGGADSRCDARSRKSASRLTCSRPLALPTFQEAAQRLHDPHFVEDAHVEDLYARLVD